MAIMDESYKELFINNKSSRFANEGYSGIHYRLPKFAQLFKDKFQHEKSISVLEIGSGLGEMYYTLQTTGVDINKHTVSEYLPEAVKQLQAKGLDAKLVDACNIDLPDNSYDIVCCFDVMHHVSNPELMAKEMLRVSRKWVYLCEANGASVIRRVGELSETAKKFGEKSYLPRTYHSFFGYEYFVKLKPFYFFVPPLLPKSMLPLFKLISEIGERIPLLRWQSQSLEIFIDKNKSTKKETKK